MRPRLLLLLVPVLVLAGCGEGGDGSARTSGTAPPADTIELTRSGGCAEAFFWAANEDGTVAVTVSTDLPPYSTDEPVVVAVDLADPNIDAALLRGHADMTFNFCNDLEDGEAEPDETIAISDGTVELEIDPIAIGGPSCGDVGGRLDLEGVVAEDGTVIAAVHAETVGIGCFAG